MLGFRPGSAVDLLLLQRSCQESQRVKTRMRAPAKRLRPSLFNTNGRTCLMRCSASCCSIIRNSEKKLQLTACSASSIRVVGSSNCWKESLKRKTCRLAASVHSLAQHGQTNSSQATPQWRAVLDNGQAGLKVSLPVVSCCFVWNCSFAKNNVAWSSAKGTLAWQAPAGQIEGERNGRSRSAIPSLGWCACSATGTIRRQMEVTFLGGNTSTEPNMTTGCGWHVARNAAAAGFSRLG